jgi:hypothetical protein
MIFGNGRHASIAGQTCFLVDGTVGTGPPYLQGRALDDVIDGPKFPAQAQYTSHPVQQQGEWWVIYGNPWEGSRGSMRFMEPETAALTQMYLDHGGSRYTWDEYQADHPTAPGAGSIYIRKHGPSPDISFSRSDGPAPPPKPYHDHASCPATPEGRRHMEKRWRSILKGELHDRLTNPLYPVRVVVPVPVVQPPTQEPQTTTPPPSP